MKRNMKPTFNKRQLNMYVDYLSDDDRNHSIRSGLNQGISCDWNTIVI